ncbi:hypothetical protein [Variovorax sp. JS1663]|uniref:hypothetical protein n=1 Tax=Variovorax sp. JS1663 TaxID=1851577 RepID=UPI000B346BA6|nr:hypothetical protein [Variovorax sp. JS1663]OUM00549.1 hypothetical protein A8M77_21005 [Variovorax sp. JS1663]
MSTKTVLAQNLKALMAQRPTLDTLPKITKASGSRLSNGKLDRVRRAAVATDIDTVEQLADVFDVSPWQLLQENLGASAALVPAKSPTAGALGDAMRAIAAAVVKIDDDERELLARMFSLLVSKPATAGNTAQSIALLLAGATMSELPTETQAPKSAPIVEGEVDETGDEEQNGPGDRVQEQKRRKTRGS